MKILYIGIIRTTGNKVLELSSAKDLSTFGYFERTGVSQFMTFFSETVSQRTQAGQRQSIEEGAYIGHTYARSEGIAGVIISDKDYPVRVAYTLINKVLDEYLTQYSKAKWENVTSRSNSGLEFKALEGYLNKYQDPAQADSIMKVQQELNEAKIILHKTIQAVLTRGENLDQVVAKSDALSNSSHIFYKQAKRTNSCCVIM